MLVAWGASKSLDPRRTLSASHDTPMWLELVSVGCLAWYVFILTVISIGFIQM